MALPELAKKMKKLASTQFLNLRMLVNGGGFAKFKKHYRLHREMGRGGFGIVYQATRIADEQPVAVKFIERRNVREWGILNEKRVPMELCMLARCHRVPGVIGVLDWFSMSEGFLIVMERPMPSIDLFDFIRDQQQLDEPLTRFFFQQIGHTVARCMERRVLHRDIKDENIVIDLTNGDTKLIDFGAATILKKSHYTDFQGTRLYCPPEWFLHSLYLGKEAAVWSLGVLLYNMLHGRLPFRSEKDICTAHLLGPLHFRASLSEDVKELLNRCLHFDPFKRCSMDELLAHPWMKTTTTETWEQLTAACRDIAVQQENNTKMGKSGSSESGVGSELASSNSQVFGAQVSGSSVIRSPPVSMKPSPPVAITASRPPTLPVHRRVIVYKTKSVNGTDLFIVERKISRKPTLDAANLLLATLKRSLIHDRGAAMKNAATLAVH